MFVIASKSALKTH
ncbi:hypothetical protein CGLO_18291 [Colletotrichum gloeosporioides Cg-14]|uniref:Uncharacterized protein n=1 Tax=Colletotrichum gloeosporioides (strain Cg-14) TaxID=1237896 RepID=T0JIB3_COLGC|nr:hypothetical protein CGLO_18291 [Colletotrichum gloeosporioides Cg-14]